MDLIKATILLFKKNSMAVIVLFDTILKQTRLQHRVVKIFLVSVIILEGFGSGLRHLIRNQLSQFLEIISFFSENGLYHILLSTPKKDIITHISMMFMTHQQKPISHRIRLEILQLFQVLLMFLYFIGENLFLGKNV